MRVRREQGCKLDLAKFLVSRQMAQPGSGLPRRVYVKNDATETGVLDIRRRAVERQQKPEADSHKAVLSLTLPHASLALFAFVCERE